MPEVEDDRPEGTESNGELHKEDERDTPGRQQLRQWLNKSMKIEMSDGRVLIGVFVCTDKDKNVILASCQEYLKPPEGAEKEEPRVLGLAMIPGHHIRSIYVDDGQPYM